MAFADYQTAGYAYAKVFDASSFAAAIRAFENALRLSPESNRDPVAFAADSFVLAMTHFFQKNESETREWLNKGIDSLRQVNSISRAEPLDDLSIWSRLELRVLQIKAERLLGQRKEENN